MGVYLTGVHLTGVHLIGVYLIGVYLTDVHLIGVYFIGGCLMGVHLIACTSLVCTLWACTSLENTCTQDQTLITLAVISHAQQPSCAAFAALLRPSHESNVLGINRFLFMPVTT